MRSKLNWLLEFHHGNRELSISWKSRIHMLHLTFTSTVKEFLTDYQLKLKMEMSCHLVMFFKCQEKHDVARTFSALLQLVNSGDVDLDRSGVLGESVCYTAAIPFHIRLLKHDDQRVETQLQMPKNRGKSPLSKEPKKGDRHKSSPEKCLSVSFRLWINKVVITTKLQIFHETWKVRCCNVHV